MPPKLKESEKLLQQLNTKTTITERLIKQSTEVLQCTQLRRITRHKEQIDEKMTECIKLVSMIQELKLTEEENPEATMEWTTAQEEKHQNWDDNIEELDKRIKQLKKDEEQERKEEEEDKWIEKQRKFHMELEEQKLKQLEAQHMKAKLPKLQLAKFDGTITDWVRFWEQFEEEIDKSKHYAAVTKFSYLRELLTSQPKTEITGLPFSEEGYETAKMLLRQKYGQTTEVIYAHGQQIASLPTITSTTNLTSIHQFYRKLNVSINSLKTLGKLDTAEIMVRQTLDKLGPIKTDIIRTDANWQQWNFEQLLRELREYTIRNPEIKEQHTRHHDHRPRHHDVHRNGHGRTSGYQATTKDYRRTSCIYCNNESHRSSDCDKVSDINERKEILKQKKLCYNCTGSNHNISNCRSRSCARCYQRHHTSICHLKEEKTSSSHQHQQLSTQKPTTQLPSLYTVKENQETIHPILVAQCQSQKFRILLDTGAGNSFVSSTFINHVNLKPVYWETKSLETMTTTVKQKLPVYNVTIQSIDGTFTVPIKVNKLDRPVLATLSNPRINQLKSKYPHLDGITFHNEDDKLEHPIHIILGAGDFANIKTGGFIAGKAGEPIAERTLLGWTLMGSGYQSTNVAFLANTSGEDYKELYSLDVLGLEENREGDNALIHQDFKEQLKRNDDGTYTTRMPWKPNHSFLPNNESQSIGRLNKQTSRLKKDPQLMNDYHQILQTQLNEGILEEAPAEPTGERISYLPHRPVIKPNRETTKIRIVYDASAKINQDSPSLNDCLHVGPSLTPLLQDLLLRQRLKPIALLGDIKQAFHQIRVAEEDRDALRLHWYKDIKDFEPTTLRFTRLPMGCAPSPFILNATLEYHLEQAKENRNLKRDVIEDIQDNLFVDDLTSGGQTETEVLSLKNTAKEVLASAGFTLYKIHSNLPELEDSRHPSGLEDTVTYAKQQVGTKSSDTKILGIPWDKGRDEISIDMTSPKKESEITKRGALRAMASIFDPLGIASPILLNAKLIYRDICDNKLGWDKQLPQDIAMKWTNWVNLLPSYVIIPRSVITPSQFIHQIEIHGFGDASKKGCCSAIYLVTHHSEGITSNLITAKSRIAKKNTTIPRLELIAGHMVSNSLDNVATALQRYPITSIHGWLDSTVALHWIKGNATEWKQFVSCRVQKIQQKTEKIGITWRHCPTKENPADIGTRGADDVSKLWLNGPLWLTNTENWPENIISTNKKEIDEERKMLREIHMTVNVAENRLGKLLEKLSRLFKLYRITAWIRRFINNCKRHQITGELSSEEINTAEKFWLKRTQAEVKGTERWEEIDRRLQLQTREDGIMVCGGRIQGEHPIYLPPEHQLTKLIVQEAHERTKHGLMSLTMGEVRQRFWIERLRKLVKSTIYKCFLCKRYRSKPLVKTGTTPLPTYRTIATKPFATTGVDFAGPFTYKRDDGLDGKAYLTLFTCATSRAVHLDLAENMEADTFRRSLKEFIARRGNPDMIVSDNAKTFQNTDKWLKKICQEANINTLLAKWSINWKFNLSRSPWWGGFFERMVGMSKNIIYKAVGRSRLSFNGLREVILEAETILNNRPLTYLEDETEQPTLTPNMILHGISIVVPSDDADPDPEFNSTTPTKLLRQIQSCKDQLWKRWHQEYLLALRERHRCIKTEESGIKIGDVMQVKGEQKNRGEWRIGIVTKVVKIKDVVVGAKLRLGTGTILERPVQLLYPLELFSEETQVQRIEEQRELEHETNARPARKAKTKAKENLNKNNEELMKDEFDKF